jgi:FMN phosphatase YigB (HAD superfamily)/DNA-binding XRE family transcriptional regulator
MDGEGTVKPEFALGKAIADARRRAGMTQQDLCMKANLSYSTLAKIERGAIKTPSVFTVVAIAQATGTPIEQLMGNVASPTPQAPQKAYKTSRTGIKFVYFDVNGTLVRYFQRAFTNIAVDSGAPEEVIERLFWQFNDAVCRGDMSLDDFNRQLADRLGWGEISWADYYIKNVDAVRDMQELVNWTAENYHVGILTNAMPGLTQLLLDRALLPRLAYDAIIDSSEVRSIKPEQPIYLRAAELAGVAPEHILIIDDNQTNLMAAEKLGWQTLWFDDYRPYDGVDRIRQALEY